MHQYLRNAMLLAILLMWCSTPRSFATERPNIVVIMADDFGWKDLHCYGNERLDTPNLDRLAEQGMRFTDGYAASPVCTPTRAAMMTGKSPARLAITNHAPGNGPNFRLPRMLARLDPLLSACTRRAVNGASKRPAFPGKSSTVSAMPVPRQVSPRSLISTRATTPARPISR